MHALPLIRRISAALGFAVALATASAADKSTALTPLASGSFSDWEHVLADASVARDRVWSFRDGVLVCTGTPVGVLYTTRAFTNFRLVVEYRWAPGQKPGNSGIMSRLTPETGAIPLTCEVQLQHGNAGDVMGLKGFEIASGGQPRWFQRDSAVAGKVSGVKRATGAENTPGEWNRVEIEAVHDHYVVRMNGTVVNEVTGVTVKPGRIGLQSEGGEVHFRNLAITPL